MKILITGSDGQLGNELQRILAKGTSEIGKPNMGYSIKDITAIDVNKVDITNQKEIRNFIISEHPNIIVNCAAYTNVDGCEENQDMAYAVNALGPQYIGQAAEEIDAQMIHVSTDYVFSGKKEDTVPYCEWDNTAPNTIYGKSKLLGEQNVLAVCKKSFIVRTSWLYGYVGNNFVKTILKMAKEKGELKVVHDQIGNPTNANDLAHHLLKLPFTNQYGIYHCTNNGICSWYDFASYFIELSGIKCNIKPCTTEEFIRPAKRPAFSPLDNMHMRNTVGDQMRSWQEAIEEYINHYNKESGEIEI